MQVYLSEYQDPTSVVSYVMETTLPFGTVRSDVEQVIGQIDKDLPLNNFQTMDELLGNYTASRRVSFLLIAGFAAIALMLATIGIYAVMANSVVRRRRELAIRIALGASRNHAAFLVARTAAMCTVAGLALGLGSIAALANVIRAFLFGVVPLAPAAYVYTLAATATLAFLACLGPGYTVLRLDPQEILREQ